LRVSIREAPKAGTGQPTLTNDVALLMTQEERRVLLTCKYIKENFLPPHFPFSVFVVVSSHRTQLIIFELSWFLFQRTSAQTRSSHLAARGPHVVTLPAETFEMIKRLVTFTLAKPGYDTEAILQTYELLIYGDLHYITNSF
jgi:hypothetical protein